MINHLVLFLVFSLTVQLCHSIRDETVPKFSSPDQYWQYVFQ